MNTSALFIRRPVMTTLIMLSILLFGAMGYRLLPVSDLPNVDFPTILVTASLPGASPETMATAVATPLERQFSTIAGLDSMTSISSLGASQITLQLSSRPLPEPRASYPMICPIHPAIVRSIQRTSPSCTWLSPLPLFLCML